MISSIKLAITKNSKPGQPNKYANFDLEDVDGSVRCILWPDSYATSGHMIVADAIVLLRGAVDRRGGGDDVNLIVNEVIPVDQADAKFTSGIRVFVDIEQHSDDAFTKLRDILRGYPGQREVIVALRMEEGEIIHIRSGKHRVDINDELRSRLDDLLGDQSHKLIVNKPKMKPPAERSYRSQKN